MEDSVVIVLSSTTYKVEEPVSLYISSTPVIPYPANPAAALVAGAPTPPANLPKAKPPRIGAAATPTISLLLLLVHLIEIGQRVGVEESHDAAQCSARRIAHHDGCSAFVVVIVASGLGRRRQHGQSDAVRREARALGGVGAAAAGV